MEGVDPLAFQQRGLHPINLSLFIDQLININSEK